MKKRYILTPALAWRLQLLSCFWHRNRRQLRRSKRRSATVSPGPARMTVRRPVITPAAEHRKSTAIPRHGSMCRKATANGSSAEAKHPSS